MAARVARRQVVYQRRGGTSRSFPWLAHRNHLHPAVHRAQDAIAQDPARSWSLENWPGRRTSAPAIWRGSLPSMPASASLAISKGCGSRAARELLADRQLSIGRVAELAGFASARDFRRVWQRHEGGAPSALSIRETARRLGRDVKAVHADAIALLNAGVLGRAPDGGIEFPYDAVKVEFLLRAA
jgi:hypothetical protein